MAVSWRQEELKDMACMLKLFRDVCGGGGRRRVKKWEEATEIGIPREQRKQVQGRSMLSFLSPGILPLNIPLHKCVSFSLALVMNQ